MKVREEIMGVREMRGLVVAGAAGFNPKNESRSFRRG